MTTTPTPTRRLRGAPVRSEIDSLWTGWRSVPCAAASGAMRSSSLERLLLEFPPGDPRDRPGALLSRRGAVRDRGSHLEAAREFRRRCRTRRPTIRWPPRRCSGSATSTPTSGAGRSSTRPTARPRSPPTRSCSTAIPAATRGQAGPGADRRSCRSASPTRSTRPRCTTYAQGLRLGDPVPQGPGRDLPAGRGRARRAGQAGAGLPDAGLPGGRAGDLRIHPAVPSRAPQPSVRARSVPVRTSRPARSPDGRMIGLFGGARSTRPPRPPDRRRRSRRRRSGLDELRFVPAREQPFKRGRHARRGGPTGRAMLELAVAGDARLRGGARRAGAAGALLHGGHAAGAAAPGAGRGARRSCSAPMRRRSSRPGTGRTELPALARIVVFARPGIAGARLPAHRRDHRGARRSTSRPPRSAGGCAEGRSDPLLGARRGRGVHRPAPVIFGRRMIKNLMTAVFGTRFDRERKRIQPIVDAIHAAGGAAQGPAARTSSRPRPRSFRERLAERTGALKAELDAGPRRPSTTAPIRSSGTQLEQPVPRAGDRLQEGAGGRRSTSSCPRRSPRCARPAAGWSAPRSWSPATSSPGTWCRTTCSSSAASCCTRAGSPRWRPARARRSSPRCRST